MEREDTIDLAIALAIGVAAGIGATLLLRSGSRQPTRIEQGLDETKRLLDELTPLRDEVYRRVDDVRDGFRKVRRAVRS
jgi:hypothetical protein